MSSVGSPGPGVSWKVGLERAAPFGHGIHGIRPGVWSSGMRVSTWRVCGLVRGEARNAGRSGEELHMGREEGICQYGRRTSA